MPWVFLGWLDKLSVCFYEIDELQQGSPLMFKFLNIFRCIQLGPLQTACAVRYFDEFAAAMSSLGLQLSDQDSKTLTVEYGLEGRNPHYRSHTRHSSVRLSHRRHNHRPKDVRCTICLTAFSCPHIRIRECDEQFCP